MSVIRNWFGRSLFLLLPLGVAPALGDPDTQLYYVSPQEVVPGHTARWVYHGYNVGSVLTISSASSGGIVPGGSLALHFEALLRGEKLKSDLIQKDLESVKSGFRKAQVEEQPGASIAKSRESSGQNHSRMELQLFTECARRTLPLLKRVEQARRAGDEDFVSEWAQVIDEERSDDGGPSPFGLPCGKFLGRAALSAGGWMGEVKLLSAASHRNADELDRILTAYLAAHSPELSAEDRPLWTWLWSRISLRAVFHRGPLPDWSELLRTFSETSVIAKLERIRVVRATGDVQLSFNRGFSLARARMGR